jgi:hypothetical protein
VKRARSLLPALSVLVVVAAGALVWHHLPTPTDVYGPFDVHADAGTRALGRGIDATVTGVRIAAKVNSVQAAGQWAVVDAALEGTRTTELPHAELIVGPNTYNPSDLFFPKTLGAEISPQFTQRGTWVFDVASALLARGADQPMTLRVWVGDGRLDSRLVISMTTDDPRVVRTDAVDVVPPVESVS